MSSRRPQNRETQLGLAEVGQSEVGRVTDGMIGRFDTGSRAQPWGEPDAPPETRRLVCRIQAHPLERTGVPIRRMTANPLGRRSRAILGSRGTVQWR